VQSVGKGRFVLLWFIALILCAPPTQKPADKDKEKIQARQVKLPETSMIVLTERQVEYVR
jgi:hypothetical protein